MTQGRSFWLSEVRTRDARLSASHPMARAKRLGGILDTGCLGTAAVRYKDYALVARLLAPGA